MSPLRQTPTGAPSVSLSLLKPANCVAVLSLCACAPGLERVSAALQTAECGVHRPGSRRRGACLGKTGQRRGSVMLAETARWHSHACAREEEGCACHEARRFDQARLLHFGHVALAEGRRAEAVDLLQRALGAARASPLMSVKSDRPIRPGGRSWRSHPGWDRGGPAIWRCAVPASGAPLLASRDVVGRVPRDRHRAEARCGFQHRHDRAVPHAGEHIQPVANQPRRNAVEHRRRMKPPLDVTSTRASSLSAVLRSGSGLSAVRHWRLQCWSSHQQAKELDLRQTPRSLDESQVPPHRGGPHADTLDARQHRRAKSLKRTAFTASEFMRVSKWHLSDEPFLIHHR